MKFFASSVAHYTSRRYRFQFQKGSDLFDPVIYKWDDTTKLQNSVAGQVILRYQMKFEIMRTQAPVICTRDIKSSSETESIMYENI